MESEDVICQLTHLVLPDNDTEGQRMVNTLGEATMLIIPVYSLQQLEQVSAYSRYFMHIRKQ